MSCCGERRAQLRARMAQERQAREQALAAAAQAPAAPVPTRLSYRSGIALVVTGPITGRSYAFGAGRAPLQVDPQDAQALLDTGRFVPAD